jgi:hypothetical protein
MMPDNDLLTADRALVTAIAKGDAPAVAAVLDNDFGFVDFNGRLFNKQQVAKDLPKTPLGDEAGLNASIYQYGEVAHVSVGRDKMFVLRIWVKRAGAWRLLVWHEVSQDWPAAAHAAGRKEWDNPCYTLPYEPKNADERDCLSSWQHLEIAVMHHEPDVWASHVADEFMVVGHARSHSRADRRAVVAEQKRTDANSAPPPLVSTRMFGFPNVMVMCCEHQPFHGKENRVSRVFVKRDGKWLMAVSFQTTQQDAPVKTI